MRERGSPSGSKPSADLFPALEPNRHGMLDVAGGHQLYWEESGNPDGVPVVFLHGGPGAGTSSNHRRFFDPDAYRIILFDQRGAGRSTPYGETQDNTTEHLIGDIAALKKMLEVSQWLVFGGSWGATLAIAYAERFPEHCLGLVLRGVFLGRQLELDWFLGGVKKVFPEAWERFENFLPEGERSDLLGNYHRRLMSDAPDIHGPAARAWNGFETACSMLRGGRSPISGNGPTSLALARIEAHYFVNGMFLDRDLLDGLEAIHHLPCAIVQGRYDMVCPISTAYALHGAWPGSRFMIVDDAGHSAMEPGIRRALVAATEAFKAARDFNDLETSP